MQAVLIRRFGGPEVLRVERTRKPGAGAGEVLVRVHAAGVNAFDRALRAGQGALTAPDFPIILGCELSGVIETVGAGVVRFKPGDLVYGLTCAFPLAGAYAEYAAVPEGALAFKPRNLPHEVAASVPFAALGALEALYLPLGAQLGDLAAPLAARPASHAQGVGARLEHVAMLIEQGQLVAEVGVVLPLSAAAQAHRLIEERGARTVALRLIT